MVRYEFWKDWKGKTNLEQAAIRSLESAKRVILENIPRKEIVSIYAKGSFVRRELNDKSDVDTVTVLRTGKYLPKLKHLEEVYRDKFKPKLQIVGYSLWELRTGNRSKWRGPNKASSSRFIKHLEAYKPIYGEPLMAEDFYRRSDKEDLQGMVGAFRKIFLPGYEERKMGFSEIAKQVFWLVENEQRIEGRNPPHSWRALDESIKNRSHIIHDALRIRLEPTKDEAIRRKFLGKLRKYLDRLDNLVK